MECKIKWDKLVEDMPYKKLVIFSPVFDGYRIPSIYSEDNKWIYLSSIDIAVDLMDSDRLQQSLSDIINSFNRAESLKQYYKMHIAEVDFHQVKEHLLKLGVITDVTLN